MAVDQTCSADATDKCLYLINVLEAGGGEGTDNRVMCVKMLQSACVYEVLHVNIIFMISIKDQGCKIM